MKEWTKEEIALWEYLTLKGVELSEDEYGRNIARGIEIGIADLHRKLNYLEFVYEEFNKSSLEDKRKKSYEEGFKKGLKRNELILNTIFEHQLLVSFLIEKNIIDEKEYKKEYDKYKSLSKADERLNG